MKKRRGQRPFEIDLSVLVDLISNAAGMMILFACVSLVMDTQKDRPPAERDAKPIDFPLAYLPVTKEAVIIALKDGRLYRLPEADLLNEVLRVNENKRTIDYVELEVDGVLGRIEFTPLGLGYRYHYRLFPDGGADLNRPIALKRKLDALIDQFPPDRYYFSINCWPDQFAYLKEVREYLIEKKMEVGWSYRLGDDSPWHMSFARGDYDAALSTIKAQ